MILSRTSFLKRGLTSKKDLIPTSELLNTRDSSHLQHIRRSHSQPCSKGMLSVNESRTHPPACGYPYSLGRFNGVIAGDKRYPIYYLNTTAEQLSAKGFDITVGHMIHDAIFNFTYTNGTFSSSLGFDHYEGVAAVGGKPASRVRAYYMAQLGKQTNDGIIWLCDGALINKEWVLSAAHCFLRQDVEPDIIRLGDYDLTVPEETGTSIDIYGKFINDYPIKDVIFHPKFKFDERYHDLVLLQLPRKFPHFSNRIRPICLPWDSESNRNLVGSQVVLTGWGATEYGGDKTTLLQEVNLRVFNPSVCDRSYSELPSFRGRYPKGMTSENILCVGWEEGGKDACGGDSGAPVAYQREDSKIVLAGIVSGGYGCGLKEYPGLYIPINKPEYLQWIKETAFKYYK